MTKSLDEIKKLVSDKYLGKGGIHSVRSQNAVRLYLEPEGNDQQSKILEEIEKEAAPYKIVHIKSERPSIM
jgi:hypothetical protein